MLFGWFYVPKNQPKSIPLGVLVVVHSCSFQVLSLRVAPSPGGASETQLDVGGRSAMAGHHGFLGQKEGLLGGESDESDEDGGRWGRFF